MRTFTYPGQRFPLRAEANDWLPRLWATRRVGWLMEQIRSNGEQKELTDEVVELGTRYGIVTPYTSFLALEPGAEEGPRPQPMRDMSGMGRVGGAPPPTSAPPPPPPPPPAPMPVDVQAVTGQAAVAQSRTARQMQEAATVSADTVTSGSVQRVGEKTFYLRDGVWTDTQIPRDGHAHLPETAVAFGSDEYYALLVRVPALARYFALGEQVAVLLDGRVYRVRATAHQH
jgi:Ca-activated chloride channel family protein